MIEIWYKIINDKYETVLNTDSLADVFDYVCNHYFLTFDVRRHDYDTNEVYYEIFTH